MTIEPSFDRCQCVAVCCCVLQCVAMCCSLLQCVAVCCSVLQCVAVCCSALQCVAVCCSVLQCIAVRCSVYIGRKVLGKCWWRSSHILSYVSALQCDALCCSMLQWVAECCIVLQSVAVCYILPFKVPRKTVKVDRVLSSHIQGSFAVRCSVLWCVALRVQIQKNSGKPLMMIRSWFAMCRASFRKYSGYFGLFPDSWHLTEIIPDSTWDVPQKRPIYLQKSPTYSPKSPIH